jgi:hypothetical protein
MIPSQEGSHDLHGASMNAAVNYATTRNIARMGKCYVSIDTHHITICHINQT